MLLGIEHFLLERRKCKSEVVSALSCGRHKTYVSNCKSQEMGLLYKRACLSTYCLEF